MAHGFGILLLLDHLDDAIPQVDLVLLVPVFVEVLAEHGEVLAVGEVISLIWIRISHS